jgi:hypothetical protein
MTTKTTLAPGSLDDDSRIDDFLRQHGGPGAVGRRGESADGLEGWSEVSAADGHVLRCDWSKQGGRTEMRFVDVSPSPTGGLSGGE